jgi:hypothetical protein
VHHYNTPAAAKLVRELGLNLKRFWSSPGAEDHIEDIYYKASEEEIGRLQEIVDQHTPHWPFKGEIVNAFRVQSERLTKTVAATMIAEGNGNAEDCGGVLLGFHATGDSWRFEIVKKSPGKRPKDPKSSELVFEVPKPRMQNGFINPIYEMSSGGVLGRALGQRGNMYGTGFYTAEDWQFVCQQNYRTSSSHDGQVMRVMVVTGVPGQDIQDVSQLNPFTDQSKSTFYRAHDGHPGAYEDKVFIYHNRSVNAHVCFPYILDIAPPGHVIRSKN